jgi:Xaa-Pro aminopeptidase
MLNSPIYYICTKTHQVWGDRRPPKPAGLLREHPLIYAGKSVPTKMAEMRAKMAEKGAVALVACALDEIAYLFNFRSR